MSIPPSESSPKPIIPTSSDVNRGKHSDKSSEKSLPIPSNPNLNLETSSLVFQAQRFGIEADNEKEAENELINHLEVINTIASKVLKVPQPISKNPSELMINDELRQYEVNKIALKGASTSKLNKLLKETVAMKNLDFIRALLDAGAQPSVKLTLDELRYGNKEVGRELAAAGFDYWDQEDRLDFIKEVWKYDEKLFKSIIDHTDFTIPTDDYISVFEDVISARRPDLVKLLLQAGAKPSESDRNLAIDQGMLTGNHAIERLFAKK